MSKTSQVLVVVVSLIIGYLYLDYQVGFESKYKYKIEGPISGTHYTKGEVELVNDGCLRFKNEDDKLVIACDGASITEL